MRYTKEEIEICREIAEHYRKPIKQGDYYYYKPNKECVLNLISGGIFNEKLDFPLWTFEDARKWLGEKGEIGILILRYQQILGISHKGYLTTILVQYVGGNYYEAEGQTPLEAILKVVLAVMKEENGKN